MRLIRSGSLTKRLAADDGFTMLFTLLALMVGTLLVAAAFTTANGDINLTQRATAQAKAYYAAVAGVSRYQYQLKNSNEYWTKCPTIANSEGKPVKVPGTTDEAYIVKTLPASKHTVCESGKQASVLETGGTANGTFRILSTGTATEGTKTVTRQIVATFSHPGFTKYVYESNYEVEDPVNFGKAASTCEYYYAERVTRGLTGTCPVIQFAPTDEVNGPMHTNDAAATCTNNGNSPKFGREGRSDEIEMNGGHYAPSGCTNEPNIVGTYTTSAGSVLPPPTDQEILEAAELKKDGRTEIELKSGSPNTMKLTNKGVTETIPFPSNGVLYVENSKEEACAVTTYTPFGSDVENDSGCGNVYVHGTYTESLTIASADDVIINGNIETSHESSGEPTGGATLGLIAENYVRLYHPVKKGYTTTNTKPETEPAIEGKCVTEKEVGGTLLRPSSTEVYEIPTTGLSTGDEVRGTAGQTEASTTISKVEAGNKIILSKPAKAAAKELSAKLVNGSTEVKEINTTGLVVGAEVVGTVAGEIESGTTISEIKAAENKIKLSKAANTAVLKEVSGKILRSTLVTGLLSTTGLFNNEDVGGPSGQIPANTKISSIKSSTELVLSLAATPPATELKGNITSGKKEVKEIATSGLSVGEEVEGSGIQTGTTIESITSTKELKLSKTASETKTGVTLKLFGETVALKFYNHEEAGKVKVYSEVAKFKVYHPTGFVYNSSIRECHKVEGSPYNQYKESENLYIVTCEFGSTYTSGAFCEYPISSSGCSSKATNLSAAEDTVNHWGVLKDPVIDAAILSTKHSWIVDNWTCGATLGTINLWGSIAQFWRGPVGQTGSHGYIKNYNYDDRLANQQPPSFLSPTNATSWKVTRETAPPAGYTG